MYSVLLNRDTFQAVRASKATFINVPDDLMQDGTIRAGTIEFIQSLITRAEEEWARAEADFRQCYQTQGGLENGAREAITLVTMAAELLDTCNYVITYRSELPDTRQGLIAARKPYVQETCRLARLMSRISDALQVKNLQRKVENHRPDLCLRGDDVELLRVRKLRMGYAEHLADVGYRLHEIFQSAIPVELNLIRTRGQVYRNTASLLIELARAEEEYQRAVTASFGGTK